MARSYSLVHLADGILLSSLAALVARDRGTTAELLAHIAEVDTRRLYVPEGFPCSSTACTSCASPRIPRTRGSRRRASRGSSRTSSTLWQTAASTSRR